MLNSPTSPISSLAQTIEDALRHHQAGRFPQAESLYRRVLAADPEHFDALHLLGVLVHQSGRPDEALDLIGRALKKDDSHRFTFNNLGEVYRTLNRLHEAEACYRKALSIKPDYVEANYNLGNTLLDLGRPEEAEVAFRRTLALRPEHAGTYNDLGTVLLDLGRPAEAEDTFRKALALEPQNAEALNNLGNALLALEQPEEAETTFLKALALKPDNVEIFNNLGGALKGLGRAEEAAHLYNKALSNQPDSAMTQWNLSLLKLLQGDLEEGFRLYEKRLGSWNEKSLGKTIGLIRQLREYPCWQGETLEGRALLVITEQGAGDTLMMMRYLPLIAELNPGRLIVYCDPPLVRVMRCLPGVDEVVPSTQPVPFGRFALYCPILSLPRAFRTRLDTIPHHVPYLSVPETVGHPWRMRLADMAGLKIGLVWAGGKLTRADKKRSIPLCRFAPLLGKPGVRLFSLQKGEEAVQLGESGWDIVDWMDDCEDFLDTAALIDQLDLIISVDTSVAHLAGALGKPVWLLNRFESEWRWMLDRENSPWYPSMRIFRQEARGDWDGVIRRLAVELELMAEKERGCSAASEDDLRQWFDEGVVWTAQEEYAAAEKCYRRVLAMAPHSLETLLNLGYVLGEQGRSEEALRCYQSILAQYPNCAEARYNRAAHLLRKGELKTGFADYEARFAAMKSADPRVYPQPRWDGSSLEGRSILVYGEQGLGDAIQFVRYLPLLTAQGGRVVLEVQEPLVPLLATLPGIERVVVKSDTPPLTDFHIPLLSLPHIFGTTLDTIPMAVPYLPPPDALTAAWRARTGTEQGVINVGLAWAGKERPYPNRSCPPELLLPLLAIDGVRFYSLQVGERERFPLPSFFAERVIDLTDGIRDFSDSAALMTNLDLIITIDTAGAHLAGALGKQTWVLLPAVADWRWMEERTDSPWYPSMRLFRQPRPGGWQSVIQEVSKALENEITARPDIPDRQPASLFRSAMELLDAGDGDGAILLFRRLLDLASDEPAAWYNLGRAYRLQENNAEAQLCFQRTLQLEPGSAAALFNLGAIALEQEDFPAAESYLRMAHKYSPRSIEILFKLGESLDRQKKWSDAKECCRRILAIEPDNMTAAYILSLIQLKSGDYLTGFSGYEIRFAMEKFQLDRQYPQPRWDGSPLNGRSILVFGEQGMGDVIQFSRYLPLVAAQARDVIFEVDEPLVPLFASFPGLTQVIAKSETPPVTDVYIQSLSLPRIFCTTLDTIPDRVPYLSPDPEKVSSWRTMLAGDSSYRIGLVWRGNPANSMDRDRSCPLGLFRPLLEYKGASFYSLQVGAVNEEIRSFPPELQPVDLSDRLNDFSDTAALIANLDLVISVDTAVAHLAGALGRPVWVLLSYLADWRWMEERPDSPWYPTMRLFRQATAGEWGEVVAGVLRELPEFTGNVVFHNQRGIELLAAGRTAEAEEAFRMAIRRSPEHAEAYGNLGVALDAQKRFEEAIVAYQTAISKNPRYVQAWYNMGNTCRAMENRAEARQCYEQTLILSPGLLPAHLCLAQVWKEEKNFTQARACLERVLAIQPDNCDALHGMGELFQAEELFSEAIEAYQRVLSIEPGNDKTLNMLGTIYHILGMLDEAETCYRKVLALKPRKLIVLNNLGAILQSLGRLQESAATLRQALAIDPSYADAHWNLALSLLAAGDYAEGWREYEWRFRKAKPVALRQFHQPHWDGSPLNGRTILLHCEQGLGDTLQFIRYAPRVAERGGRVIVECQLPSLKRILERVAGVSAVVAAGEPLPAFDCHAYLMSLPRLFRTTVETIPSETPYLHADPADVATWRERLGAKDGLRVGLVWSGRQNQLLVRKRSCNLAAFAPLAAVPNVTFYSLQVGDGAEQADAAPEGMRLIDLTGHIRDFADTAALIANLDLVITIDTSVAHLVGGMGRPVWVLLSIAADWRWMLHSEDSPWYLGMRLFRQPVAGEWQQVMGQMASALGQFKFAFIPSPNPHPTGDAAQASTSASPSTTPRKAQMIGLAWAGRPTHPRDRQRSCTLAAFAPLAALRNTVFQSLQLGDGAEQGVDPPSGMPLADLTAHIHDFEDTAAFVANLDLVITVDTSIAHLAGAMGKPAWVLLSHSADWRWLQQGDASPWYPSLRLFRQLDFGDWDGVIRSVAAALQEEAPGALDGSPQLRSTSCSSERSSLEQTLERKRLQLAARPADPDAHQDVGAALALLGRHEEAVASYRKALELSPEHIGAHLNLAFSLLALGEFAEGWRHHEWRYRRLESQLPPWPLLRQSDLGSHRKGTSVLVHCEQGYGDAIQFIRFVPLLADLGYRVTVTCQRELASLIGRVNGVSRTVPHGELLPVCDLQVLLLTLPHLFGTTLNTIPVAVPYLAPSPQRVSQWRSRIFPNTSFFS